MTLIRAFHRCVGVYDVLGVSVYRRNERRLTRLCSGCRIPCFSSSRALVTRHILFCKPLFDCFGFPVIVSDPPSSFNYPGTKLSEHRLGCNNCDLSRPIRVWKYFLVNQLVLLLLCSNNLVQRPIFIEQKVRVSIAQDTCTFRSKHETFLASVCYVECPHFELSISQRLPCR